MARWHERKEAAMDVSDAPRTTVFLDFGAVTRLEDEQGHIRGRAGVP